MEGESPRAREGGCVCSIIPPQPHANLEWTRVLCECEQIAIGELIGSSPHVTAESLCMIPCTTVAATQRRRSMAVPRRMRRGLKHRQMALMLGAGLQVGVRGTSVPSPRGRRWRMLPLAQMKSG